MANNCTICVNGLTKLVKQYVEEGRSPKKMRELIFAKYGISLTYRQVSNHIKQHDPDSGSLTQKKDTIGKVLTRSKRQVIESGELLAKSRELMESIQKHFSRVLGVQEGMDEDYFRERFAKMSPGEQIRTLNQTIDTMGKLKKIEMEQERMDREANPALDDIFKIASRAGMTPKDKKKLTSMRREKY